MAIFSLIALDMTPETRLPNRFQIWWLAIRPRTLPAAAAGVVAGSALALHDRTFRLLPALAALLVALLLQIGSNLANDVFDYERGRIPPGGTDRCGLPSPGCSPPARSRPAWARFSFWRD